MSILLLPLFFALSTSAASFQSARFQSDHLLRATITIAAGKITAKEAASIARRKHGGKVLSVKQDGGGNFQVKLLQDSGRVMIITVSAGGKVRG